MSPEQGTGQPVDRRSDIYSLGIVLYHALTGRVPFTADSPLSITVKHLNDPIPIENLRVKGVPQPIEQVLLKMTAKAPADRYQTTDELIEALTRALTASQLTLPRWRTGVQQVESPGQAVEPPGAFSSLLSNAGGGQISQPLAPISHPSMSNLRQQLVTVPCFRCGAANQSDRLFCTSCGYELSDKWASADSDLASNGRPLLARLSLQNGQMAGRTYLFHQVVTTIGRTNGNDLIISGRTVSRRHARLWFEGGRWYLGDMQSANGTLVNTMRLQPNHAAALNDGDVINFGDEIVVFNIEYGERRYREPTLMPGSIIDTNSSAEETHLSLFAIAHAELEEGNIALIGKTYSLHTGISQFKPESKAESIQVGPIQIKPEAFDEEPFDFAVSSI